MAVTTFRQIQDRALDLLSKSDSVTRNRLSNWINLGQQDFVYRELWPFREETGTLNFTQGTQEYDISTEFPDIDEQNIISVALQAPNNKKLTYRPFNQLRASKPDFQLDAEGVPQIYYIKSGKIGFWPVPNSSDAAAIDYYKIPTDMDDDTDEPMMPVAYRESLVHYALSLEHDFNTDPDLAIKSQNRYEQIVTLARNNLLAQPTDTEAFRVLGPADAKDWTGLSGEIR